MFSHRAILHQCLLVISSIQKTSYLGSGWRWRWWSWCDYCCYLKGIWKDIMTIIITILIIILITHRNDLNVVSSLFHYITIIVWLCISLKMTWHNEMTKQDAQRPCSPSKFCVINGKSSGGYRCLSLIVRPPLIRVSLSDYDCHYGIME